MKETCTAIPWSLLRQQGPADFLALDRGHPELWQSISAMSHSLLLKFLVVAALETITVVDIGFLRISELFSEALATAA